MFKVQVSITFIISFSSPSSLHTWHNCCWLLSHLTRLWDIIGNPCELALHHVTRLKPTAGSILPTQLNGVLLFGFHPSFTRKGINYNTPSRLEELQIKQKFSENIALCSHTLTASLHVSPVSAGILMPLTRVALRVLQFIFPADLYSNYSGLGHRCFEHQQRRTLIHTHL
jgi:hypothetical protein